MIGTGLGLRSRRHNPAGVVLLDPSTDTSVAHWWRADLGVTSASGKVSAVADQRGAANLSGFSGDATGTLLTANDPNFNGHSSVRVTFNSNQLYTPSAFTLTPNFGILVVGLITTTQYYFRSSGGTAALHVHNQGTTNSVRLSTGSGAIISSYAASADNWLGVSTTVPVAVLLSYAGTHASHKVYRNSGATDGSLVSFTGAQTAGDPGDASAINQLLFDTDGAWAESIVFNTAPTTAQTQAAFAYVLNRYGI